MNVKTPAPVPFMPAARGRLTEMRSLATFTFTSGLRNALFPAKNLLFNNANACQMCSNGRVPLRELSCGERPEKKAKFEKMPSANLMNTSKIVLKFTKVVPDAFAPTKGSEKAAGFDLKSAYDYTVPARGKEMIDTGIKIQLPEGCYGRIAPRSGLAAKHFIDVGAGVVDEDYRGVIKVILFNHSNADFKVNRGDRIAQLICERIYYPEIVETQELNGTERGEGGFGSTGTN